MKHANYHLQIKALSETGVIEGVAAGYGNVDSHGDIFAPGAFAASLAALKAGGRQPAMLLFHDTNRPAGRWDDFQETTTGLHVKGSLALDASDGREAYALLKNGALGGLSVGFRALKSKIGANGANIITEAELFEVSLVSVPSNPLTKISAVKGIGNVRELEELLREHGMSGRAAKRAAGAAFRVAEQTEEPIISAKAVRNFTAAINNLSRFHRS